MILTVILFVLGLCFLVKGAGFLVDGSASLAKRMNISNLVIGLTVVAFGTSAPELAVNILSSLSGKTDIAIGNVVGSNIFNVFWIMGISSIIHPLPLQQGANYDILVMAVASVLLFLFLFIGKRHVVEKWQGVLFLVFMFYLWS